MEQIGHLWRCFWACTLMFASCTQSWGQTIVFTASVSTSKMGLQDHVQLTYTIQNPQQDLVSVGPEGDRFKDFVVVGGPSQHQSNQMSVVGNQMRQLVSLNIIYILQPKRTGTLTIPAGLATDANGNKYTSNTVQIEVVAGSLTPVQQRNNDPFADDPFFQDPFAAIRQRRQQQQRQQEQHVSQITDINKDLFIKVHVDKNKVHAGEQITTSYKLYARVPMNMSISKLPSLNGFWTQDFQLPKNQKPVEEIVDGKKFQVFTLKKSALFPQQAGTLILDPAEAEGVARIIQQVRQRNPFADMFDNDPFFQQAFGGSLMMNDPFFNDNFFNTLAYKDVPVHLKSKPVQITVTALPENGKPADFGGAVGNFTVSSRIDKTELTTDDVANFTLTITGSGNLKLIEVPRLRLPNGMDSYDPHVMDTITGRTTTISGSKIITYPITVHTPGDYEIPSIPFTYYDPQRNAYTTLHTQPVRMSVKPGKNHHPGTQQHRIAAMGDIHDINKEPLIAAQSEVLPVVFTVTYWSAYGIPLLAFLMFAVYRRREEELSRDIVKLKHRKASKIALKRLGAARKLLQQEQRIPFYEEISKALWLYLSDKLSIPLSELSRERAAAALSVHEVPDTLWREVTDLMDDCEMTLYAPAQGTQQMQHVYGQAVKVISNLEETFKS